MEHSALFPAVYFPSPATVLLMLDLRPRIQTVLNFCFGRTSLLDVF